MVKTVSLLALVAALAACGTNRVDRAVTGGAIGATAGIVGAAVSGSDVASGAIVGGAIGAAAGGLTDAEDFDLGKPIYRD